MKHDKVTDIPWDFKKEIKLDKIKELKGTENFYKPRKSINQTTENANANV